MASLGGKRSMAGGRAKPSGGELPPDRKRNLDGQLAKAAKAAKRAKLVSEGKAPRSPTNPFEQGNELWKRAKRPGRKRIFEDPQDLWDACCAYFEWATDNPLLEAKLVSYEGANELVAVPRMRAMTLRALCVFIDVDWTVWSHWRLNREDLAPVIAAVDDIIYSRKYEGAAAGMLNPMLVTRDLGLIDRREQTGAVQVIISNDDAEL